MFRTLTLTAAALAAALAFASPATAQSDSTLRVYAPLFKTKTKGDGSIRYSPFKAKGSFRVTVALYDGADGAPLLDAGGQAWSETYTVNSNESAPSNLAAGTINEASRITGLMDLVLGATNALPDELLDRDAFFTTQVTLLKNGQVKTTFEESPRRPLGIAGITKDRNLFPASVETEALTVTDNASTGRVLTSDAQGNASWQELPAGPGVSGTPNRLAVFDSANSIGNSSITDSGSQVVIETDTVVSGSLSAGASQLASLAVQGSATASSFSTAGTVSGNSVVSTGNVIASNIIRAGAPSSVLNAGDVGAADDLVADDDVFCDAVSAGTNISAGGFIEAGNPSTAAAAGDVVADDDILADDDVVSTSGVIRTGNPSESFNDGDIVATDDLVADDDLFLGGAIFMDGEILRCAENSGSDLFMQANQRVAISKNFDSDNNFDESFEIWDGLPNFGELQLELEGDGDLFVVGNVNANNVDLAENFPTRDGTLHTDHGAVVALDPTRSEHVKRAVLGGAEVALGIVSTAPGFVLGARTPMGDHPELRREAMLARMEGDDERADELMARWQELEDARDDRVAVALKGRVPVQVDLSFGPIAPGDLLGLSATPGVAARYNGYGPSIGIAMESYNGGSQPIVAFVQLDHSPDAQWSPSSWSEDEVLADLDEEGIGAAAEALVTSERSVPERGAAQPEPLTGAGQVPAGFDRVIVEHPGLTTDALPVVTFYGNPGGASWVSERGTDYFVLQLEHPAPRPLDFGYTVRR